MKLGVIGGSGTIGTRVVNRVRDSGHEVRVGTRQSGVDAVTGAGLDGFADGLDVVIDVSNSPAYGYEDSYAYFATSTRNVLAAEQSAGVGHHVALSILGADRVNGGYFRAKLAQERLVAASSVPHTIVRSTLFFEFLDKLVEHAATTHLVRLPSVAVRPVAADDVARLLAHRAFSAPTNGAVEIAGPDEFFLDELGRQHLAYSRDARQVLADPAALYLGAHLGPEDRSLVPSWQFGPTRFPDWLDELAG